MPINPNIWNRKVNPAQPLRTAVTPKDLSFGENLILCFLCTYLDAFNSGMTAYKFITFDSLVTYPLAGSVK